VGISSIVPNTGKVKEMCERIREHRPGATIVVGGHIASREGLDGIIDADHIVKGDGISWFRRYLGENEKAPVRHPWSTRGSAPGSWASTCRKSRGARRPS